MSILNLLFLNESWMLIDCEYSILRDLSNELTFPIPGSQFTPAFKKGFWDGKIRLIKKNRIYVGLLSYIQDFCEKNNYKLNIDPQIQLLTNYTKKDFDDFINNIIITNENNEKLIPFNYQQEALLQFILNKRKVILSATASGKSLIMYLTLLFYLNKLPGKFLVIVPNISLVEQLFQEFKNYSHQNNFDVENQCTKVYSGKEKDNLNKITISTWQSMFRMPKEYLSQFTLLIGDEVHTQKSKETSGLIENLTNCSHRFGLTGTLDNEKIHELVIRGLFGDIQRVSKSIELIESKQLSKILINCITFHYSEKEIKEMRGKTWEDEINFINSHEKRTKFIVKLASSLNGNCLIVFSRVEKHGKIIYDKLKNYTSKNVYFIYGAIKAEERENIRNLVENTENNIIVATSQIFAQGINIKSLQHIIFAHPSKSRIRVLQSIGRILRKSDRKNISYVHDLSDKTNYSFKHLKERVKMYIQEEFPYKFFQHNL